MNTNLRVPAAHLVIGYALKTNGREFVAAHLSDNEVTPYVTWEMGLPEADGRRPCYHGHYLYGRDEALADLIVRAS